MKAELPPIWLVDVIRSAEETWQEQLNPLRRLTEVSQENLARLEPALVASQDYSIGTCNVRPSAARQAANWIIEQGWAYQVGIPVSISDIELVGWIMDSAREARIVQCILMRLRASHPMLMALSWEQIAQDDLLIAKLYSGYMGAGGAWGKWLDNLQPGSEALLRLGCDSQGLCSLVQSLRPSAAQ